MINPLSAPLHVPLGIHISEEVEAVSVEVEVSAIERELMALSEGKGKVHTDGTVKGPPPAKSLSPDIRPMDTRRIARFNVNDELMKMKLAYAIESSREPFSHLLDALSGLGGEGGKEQLESVPSMLDFFPEELKRVAEPVRRVTSQDDGFGDLGSDSFYKGKKNENVEAIVQEAAAETANQSAPVEDAQLASAALPVAGLVKTTADGVSIAHSPCAYDLSGSMPWSCYSTDGYSPMSPMDLRYHRVHLCSPNVDKAPAIWPVFSPKPAVTLEVPRDGTCSFRNSGHLSLKDSGQFVLIESVEQFPLLMHYHGMSASILRYWRPKHSASATQPDADQLSQMGTLGQLVKLESEFLPRVYGGSAIKVDSTTTAIESSLLRAPMYSHKISRTDFLLVRSKPLKQGQFHCVLRPIESVFCVGQAEPLYRVDVPVVPRLHQMLSARVMLECRRFWLRAKQHPNLEFVNRMFFGERRSLLTRYFSDALRDITSRPSLPLSSPISPEEACVVNSMKEGMRRLAERGIERICAISPMRIRNYVRDIEIFERSMPAASRTPRIAHYCVQLENEMRSSPWNLTNDYWDVMIGKRGAMFQFSPLGDPSGGRGEGISFRKILKVEGSSAAAALGSIAGARKGGPEMDDIRAKGKKDLIAELEKLNVPERVWKSMSRWQLMRQLALLLGIEDETEERLAPWKRKALHTDRIFDAWRKQNKALADTTPPAISHDELRKAAEAYGITQMQGQSGATTPDGDFTPPESGSEDEFGEQKKNLEEMMLDDLMGLDQSNSAIVPVHPVEEGEMELEMLLRDIRGEEQPMAAPIADVEPVSDSGKKKVTRLQIVSTGRTKSTGNPWSQVTYVYGTKNIAMYRKWKELEEEGFPHQGAGATSVEPSPAESVSHQPAVPTDWQYKVETSLKVHRRFQRIIRQAAEAGRPIPDCKRCGACHLYGHDQTYEGCPMMLRDMDMGVPNAGAARKRKNLDQSPVYD